ncbi:aconitase X [Citreimonas salinaria]|uniref:Predicted aconitase subunit 1 n=1 Tax=Citreimonas salinaria TaxID=321339 RepID=A0A1H3LAZ7_9RHOB|nr:aconitase X catalytic domain-containing protein [Citreimonas salinaria]SDY61561.1 predicted aconitase subunit 1 [Citreimonas salinaria]
MRLSDAEKAMLDGDAGPAKARAMDLLLRYGEALGADRLIEVSHVAGTWSSTTPFVQADLPEADDFDTIFSRFNLDSDITVETPRAVVPTCQLIHGIDTRNHAAQGFSDAQAALQRKSEHFFGSRGVQWCSTCTPYQVGHVPLKGQHVAWMESSAVVYANAVIGARTNVEGRESTGAASITGRIPYFGLHVPENRVATHRVDVEIPVRTMRDWGLLGYAVGSMVQEEIPVLCGIDALPRPEWLKHFGAAAASSGGVEMYHIPGVTPEAASADEALGGTAPRHVHRYGAAERRRAWDRLNGANTRDDVNFVMLGCPHNSSDQMWRIAELLEGRRVHGSVALWVHTPRQIRHLCDESGVTGTIERAGALVMSDSCPAINRMTPQGTQVIATDSCKQAHYLPAITGYQTWFGSLEDCIDAAITGRFRGSPE